MPRFCTALHQGQPCTRRALPGQPFCYGHHPNPVDFPPVRVLQLQGPALPLHYPARPELLLHPQPTEPPRHTPPTPLVPRTPRQKAQAKWLIFINLPQSKMALLELQPDHALAGVP
jgi:hypothetical protein